MFKKSINDKNPAINLQTVATFFPVVTSNEFVFNFKFEDGRNLQWIYATEEDRNTDFTTLKGMDLSAFDFSNILVSLHEEFVDENGEIVWTNMPINGNNVKYIQKFSDGDFEGAIENAKYAIMFMFKNNWRAYWIYTSETDMMDDWNAITM